MKVKICGITNVEDALLAENLGADALGFIFYKKSKRYVSPQKAEEIIKKISPFTNKVGVFVNETAERVNKISFEAGLNTVQLHGDELPEEISLINLPVIKSFRINNGFDFSNLSKFTNVAFLLDSFSESEYGGTGKKFNWSIIPDNYRNRIILSGGVSASNIEEIYKNIKPAAVDISSSLESEPGKKDKGKVQEFFKTLNYLRRQNGNNDET